MGRDPRLGLALGGGGVRGGAHIGLLKVLDREGIEVGPIAGTSAGGLVGGLYAAGLSGREIEEFLTGLARGRLLDPEPSGWSLLSTGRFARMVARRVGHAPIEDLPHPFAAVAVDLRQACQVLITHGPLATAIQATIAVPGLLCPVEQDGCLLVDGGVLNNVPVDAVRRLGAERVLAVDVKVQTDFSLDTPLRVWQAPLPGLLPRLIDRLLTLTGRQRAIAALSRTIDIVSAELAAQQLRASPPDLLLHPDLSAIPLLSIAHLPEAIAAGERLAEAHLGEIRALALAAAAGVAAGAQGA